MYQSPLEGNSFSANEEIPSILCNLKFHCRFLKIPPPVLILTQINQVRAYILYRGDTF
jgi:hypothetical protein